MKEAFNEHRIWIVVILLAALIVGGYSYYRSGNTRLIDKASYKEFRDAVTELADKEEETGVPAFENQEALRTFITDWADDHSLEYKIDKGGNVIFDKEAVKRKKNTAPTLVCVSMNYETATSSARLLASAAAIAVSDLEAGRKTVIFVNDEQNLGSGYRSISRKYLTSGSKVIYLDYGSSSYLSTASFEERFSEISIPADREPNPCDTAVKVTISGIDSGVIGPGISMQPDPISAFSSLLTRLKSKSAIYRLADVKVVSNGNMYPVSLEATIVLNSYAAASFTGYIDKRIKAWDKAYGKDYENLEYKYEVISDYSAQPETVYTAKATDKLAGVLYTIKSGAYRYAESDAIPEGKEAGDVYGINCMLGLNADGDSIDLSILTQGFNDSFTNRMLYDNKAAADLYKCDYKDIGKIDAFVNDQEKLSRTFMKTYRKVNDMSSPDSELPYDTDNFFTPCSYLAQKNSKADIIHIRVNSSSAYRIANTILCYIKTKGNTSFF